MAFEVVCCMMLGDAQVYNHLMPIANDPLVSRIWIVRTQQSSFGEIPKAEYVLACSRFKVLRWIKMAWACLRLGGRKEVRAFVSFNPIPYGLIGFLAAKWNKKPIHFGFIGADWYKYSKGNLGKFLLLLYRKADFITATGITMKEEMLSFGIQEDRIKLLSHPVDLERFPIGEPFCARYSCVFVGQLIHRKRIDIILKAFAKVLEKYPKSMLCLVGDGPLNQELKNQAVHLGILDNVDFVGFTSNVQAYLTNSKIVIIASDGEGFPFALVEGICCGLVPISTPVGTITDYIVNEQTGLLFPQGDSIALSYNILRLIEDQDLYDRLRMNSLELRKKFSFKSATVLWNEWFQSKIFS